MKRVLVCAILAMMTLSLVPAHADQSGSVLLPIGDPTASEPADSRGLGRVARCAAPADGIFGATIDVTPRRAFTLEATGANAAMQDFDILFYTQITLCHENSASPTPTHTNRAGNEAGTVPVGATQAIVVLYSGFNGTFTYSE